MNSLEVKKYLENEEIILNYIIEYAKSYINDKNKDLKEKVLLQLIKSNVGSIGYEFDESILYEKSKALEYFDIDIIIERILSSSAFILFDQKYYIKDSEIILLDFLNYVAKLNNYSRKFTFKDLYDKYKTDEYIFKLEELKDFLIDVEMYSKLIKENDTLDKFVERNLKYKGKVLEKNIASKVLQDSLDYDLSVLIYAYSKNKKYKFKSIKNEMIKDKIMEMKKRDY